MYIYAIISWYLNAVKNKHFDFYIHRYDKDFYRPRFKSHPMANTVELLRIKHWLTRQALELINELFGMQMGLSVILLWVMAVFDVYYEIYRNSPTKILVFGWLLQYSFRLFMIILFAHHTTKQVKHLEFIYFSELQLEFIGFVSYSITLYGRMRCPYIF